MRPASVPRRAEWIRASVTASDVDRMWSRLSAGERARGRRRVARVAGVAAAAAAIVLVVVLAVWPRRPAPHAVATGQHIQTGADVRTLVLPDASRVTLEAQSVVSVLAVREDEVRLQLGSGKLVCDVSERPGRRFIVHAAATEVVVTGTRFEVELRPDRAVSVSVERGAVEVRDTERDTHALLKAGQSLTNRPAGAPSAPAAPLPASVAPPAPAPAPSTTEAARPATPAPSSAPPSTETAKQLFDAGSAARLAGRHAEAADAYARLVARFPNDPHTPLAAYQLGRIRLGSLGDAKGALAAFGIAAAGASGALKEDAEVGRIDATAALGDVGGCRRLREVFVASRPGSAQIPRLMKLCGGP